MWYVDKYRLPNLICLHAVSSANLMDGPWLLRNVTMHGLLLLLWYVYYGIVEFSVRDKQWVLLLWRISNVKKYVKVTNNFLQCSCFHNSRTCASAVRAVSPEEVVKDMPVQRPVAKVTPLFSYTCWRRATYTLHTGILQYRTVAHGSYR